MLDPALFSLVPLGGALAATCATAVILSANWQVFVATFGKPNMVEYLVTFFFWGPATIAMVPLMASTMSALAATVNGCWHWLWQKFS